jgi:hypothetical protein
MSFLNRSEEATVPSWPAPSITTGKALAFCVVTPWMFPMKQVPFTFAPAMARPIQITSSAVMTPAPKATLKLPVVLFSSELKPMAVLRSPLVLATSALTPLAVL